MGLWFELPITPHLIAPSVLDLRISEAKGGPHVTIVHFGDLELDGEEHAQELRSVAEEVIDEAHAEFDLRRPWTLDVTGSGRFLVGPRDYPVDVLMVQGKQLGLLCDMLKDALSSRVGINVDDTYQWVPHISLSKGDPVVLQRQFQVAATTLDLVHSKGGKERGRWRTSL